MIVDDPLNANVSHLSPTPYHGPLITLITRPLITLKIGDLSNVTAPVLLSLNDADTELIAPGSLYINPSATLTAVADASVNIAQNYSFRQTDENKLLLDSAKVHFDGNGSANQFVEAGGFDIGTLPPVAPNFGFGQMVVGTDSRAVTLHLRDAVDNGNGQDLCGPGAEALYLMGLPADAGNPAKILDGLRILGGSTLVLDGVPLYVMQNGSLDDVRTYFPSGQSLITYNLNGSNGFIDLGTSPETDADQDTITDVNDNCPLLANTAQRDTDMDGYGNMCDADLDNSGRVNATDLAIFKTRFRSSDPDADFNGDGRVNATDLAILKTLFAKPPGPSCVTP